MRVDAFVSYAKPDLPRVEKLYAGLIAQGIRLWIDTADLRFSTPWRDAVRSGIVSARVVVLAVSLDWVASKACEYELAFARDQQKPLIPVIVSAPPVSPALHDALKSIEVEIIDCSGSLAQTVDVVAARLREPRRRPAPAARSS